MFYLKCKKFGSESAIQMSIMIYPNRVTIVDLINVSEEIAFYNIIPGSKFKTNQYRKIRLPIFDIWYKSVRQMC